MWNALLVCLILSVVTACRNDEDILPAPPPVSSAPTAAVEPELAEGPADQAFDLESELFQYGMFKKMPYRILFPRKYDATKSYPLHIFLHGIGERGTDNEKQLALGAKRFQLDSIRDGYPAFIVFPQCPTANFWSDESVTEMLRGLIDNLLNDQRIDPTKISIGGFSMGAYGTFAMVARNPELFHAAIAISGDGDQSKASLMAKSKWRLFAGQKDAIVPSRRTEQMASALASAGASVSFILYPNADHGRTWINAFSEPDFFRWIFSGDQTPLYRAGND